MPRHGTRPSATREHRRLCRFCGRDICVNSRTGQLRHHHVPAGVDTGVYGATPGSVCPGTGS